MDADLAAFFNTDEFAETILYTPKGGGIVMDITAIILRNNPLQEIYVRGEETAACEIEVKAGELENLQQGDTFTFNNETWGLSSVLGVVYKDSNVLRIALEREMS